MLQAMSQPSGLGSTAKILVFSAAPGDGNRLARVEGVGEGRSRHTAVIAGCSAVACGAGCTAVVAVAALA